MDYGITWADLRRVSLLMAGVSVLVILLLIPVGITHGTLKTSADAFRLLSPWLVGGQLLPLFLVPGLLLRLRVADGSITQFVFGRKRSTKPIGELEELSLLDGTFPVVLTFRDGTRMRLFASHRRERLALLEHLKQELPDLIVHYARWCEPEPPEEEERSAA